MNGPVKRVKFRKTYYFSQGSPKIIKVLKAESVVSENAGHHRTHIYLQHMSIKSNIICLYIV